MASVSAEVLCVSRLLIAPRGYWDEQKKQTNKQTKNGAGGGGGGRGCKRGRGEERKETA